MTRRRHKIEALRQRAVVLRHNAARDILEAKKCDDEADALSSDVLDEDSAAETVAWYFNCIRRMRRAH